MVVPSVPFMDGMLSLLLESVNEDSPTTYSLKTPIHNMGPVETYKMVQDLELVLRSFQDHLHLRLSQYRSHQNVILPPISKLPVEIFSHILHLSVTVHDWTTVPDWSITRLQELAQVAKAWKEVVLGTPELWGVIKVHHRPSINSRWQEDLNLALTKSRSAPLTVVYGIETEEYSSEMESEDMDEVEDIITLVRDHATRLQTILHSGFLSPAMTALLQLPTPSLKRFSLNSSHRWANQLMPPLSLSSAQELLHVEAQNIPVIWSEFKGLISLQLVNVRVEKENDQLADDLLVVLQSCPDLELLVLGGIGSSMEGEGAGLMEERSIQRIMARSQRIDLSSLWSLTIKNLAPVLVLTIVFGVCAPGISELHLEVGQYFLTALPDINATQLIKPAFDRALDCGPESRLYIVQYSHSLRIQNRGDESWEEQMPKNVSFKLYIHVNEEVTEGEALEHLSEFLQYSSRPISVQLELGLGNSFSENASCMISFPVYILDRVVEIRLHGNRAHNSEILLYLSLPQTYKGSNTEPTYPCSQLTGLWIRHRKWKHILNFLDRRYGPRPTADEGEMIRARLPAITFQYEPTADVLPRIEQFVERWKFIEL
ncbi:hypothetical protein FRB95_000626 [Tulasnella sp. JGI-2019a]|nr:hypothetical protein FRB95_000626 [Tulasnella sp. JGI-2019a]